MKGDASELARFTISAILRIRTCREEDLSALEWFGMFTPHREIIQATFERQQRGEAVMLLADLNNFPVGQVWLDLEKPGEASTATVWAVRVLPYLQKLAIGTRLMSAAEELLLERGFTHAELTVETNNPGARRFYERLGYQVVGREKGAYSYTTPEGALINHTTDSWRFRKALEHRTISQRARLTLHQVGRAEEVP
jgi:ribosomal protein S18 acetylase RimI-like enzyme